LRILLRNRRNELGITQKQMAEQTFMSLRNYTYIEHGRHEPNLATMQRIADVLGVRPSIYLFQNFEGGDAERKTS
jgi:transcriptional regulator with XRE-family HTH domain